MPGQRVEFDEGVLVQQRQDALAGGQLALGVHLLDRRLADRVQRLFGPPAQVGQLARGGVDVDLVLGGGLGLCSVTLVMGVDASSRRARSTSYGRSLDI